MVTRCAHEYLEAVQDSIRRAKSIDQITKYLTMISGSFGITDIAIDPDTCSINLRGLRDAFSHSVEEADFRTDQLEQLFYSDLFPAFADTLLSVVASDWLPSFPIQEKYDLFHRFFAQAPAEVLLSTLVAHLSLVRPLSGALDAAQSSLTVQAPGADTAAAILAERFALPDSSGIQDLSSACQIAGSQEGRVGNIRSEELASLLVSIPDRATLSSLRALQPAAFVRQTVDHCTEAARGHTDTSSLPCSQKSAQCQSLDSTSGAFQASVISIPCFEAAVLTRLAKRGHASIIAQEAWNAISSNSTHPPSEAGNPGIHAEESSFSEDGTAASACEEAMSDGRASHARASTLHDSHSASTAVNGRHQGKRETVASSRQAPSANPAAPSHPAQAEDSQAETDLRNSAAIMTIQRLLCQITDSQALEKILAALLLEAPAHFPQKSAQVLEQLLSRALWQRQGVRYLFENKLLLRKCVPPGQLNILMELLARLPAAEDGQSSLQHASVRLAQAWGSEDSIQRLPLQHQAYMTAALVQGLQLLGREQLESTSGLFPALLTGVSARLDSPEGPPRKQGMRVGKAFSTVLDSSKPPLFSDLGDTDLSPAEAWHPSCITGARLPSAVQDTNDSQPPQAEADGPEVDAGYDSDVSLEAFDLSEGPNTEDFEQEGHPLQLRDAAALLRKGDDPQAVLKGLRVIGPLIEAAPEELRHSAGEVARALLYARPPEWADREAASAEQKASLQRFNALAAVCEAAPDEGGLALAKEVYSPNLDMHQRLTILDALSTAARHLSSALPASEAAPMARLPESDAEPGGREAGKSRRWAVRSLAKQQEAAPRTRRNRFVSVAAQWTAALLDQVDQERQGVDLFGRDALVLGHVLSCLGTFVECASPAKVTLWLASVVLELVAAKEVHAHSQPFVRRSALIAASQVMRALPAAGLAGLLTGGQVSEGVLAERLEWCQGWTQRVAMQDADPQCQMLAAGCQSLQAKLAQEAMQALELGADSELALTGQTSKDVIIPKGV